MSFVRHQEIFPSDGGASLAASAPAHRLDEFPADYSSAGCSPAEPAFASPAEYECALKSSCRSRSFHRTANCVLTVCVTRGGNCNPPATAQENRTLDLRQSCIAWHKLSRLQSKCGAPLRRGVEPRKQDRYVDPLGPGIAHPDRAMSLVDDVPDRGLGVDFGSPYTQLDLDVRSRR